MTEQSTQEKRGLKAFRRRKALTVMELLDLFGCSLRTVQRRLKIWQARTSYNHNGRYYTLPDIPTFDAHGLWHYRDISFSKYGNLKKTVVCLVSESPHGLRAAEIGAILRMNPQSFLSHFQDEPGLNREKVGGRFVWFAADVRIRKKQKQGRSELECQEHMAMPSNREAVMIVVDLLHHPDTCVKEIARRMKPKGVEVAPKIIHEFLAHHDLVKKTTAPGSSVV